MRNPTNTTPYHNNPLKISNTDIAIINQFFLRDIPEAAWRYAKKQLNNKPIGTKLSCWEYGKPYLFVPLPTSKKPITLSHTFISTPGGCRAISQDSYQLIAPNSRNTEGITEEEWALASAQLANKPHNTKLHSRQKIKIKYDGKNTLPCHFVVLPDKQIIALATTESQVMSTNAKILPARTQQGQQFIIKIPYKHCLTKQRFRHVFSTDSQLAYKTNLSHGTVYKFTEQTLKQPMLIMYRAIYDLHTHFYQAYRTLTPSLSRDEHTSLLRDLTLCVFLSGIALHNLHTKEKHLHGDFKLENVLVRELKSDKGNPQHLIQLCDFEHALPIDEEGNPISNPDKSIYRGTTGYQAPEVENNAGISVQSDIYAFAITHLDFLLHCIRQTKHSHPSLHLSYSKNFLEDLLAQSTENLPQDRAPLIFILFGIINTLMALPENASNDAQEVATKRMKQHCDIQNPETMSLLLQLQKVRQQWPSSLSPKVIALLKTIERNDDANPHRALLLTFIEKQITIILENDTHPGNLDIKIKLSYLYADHLYPSRDFTPTSFDALELLWNDEAVQHIAQMLITCNLPLPEDDITLLWADPNCIQQLQSILTICMNAQSRLADVSSAQFFQPNPADDRLILQQAIVDAHFKTQPAENAFSLSALIEVHNKLLSIAIPGEHAQPSLLPAPL